MFNRKTHVTFQLLIGIVYIVLNFWELKKDFVSLLSLIDAILLQLKLYLCIMEELLLVQLEPGKLKLSKILEELSVFTSSSPIVEINTDQQIWLKYLKDWSNQVYGVVLTNSIESIQKSYLSLQVKSNQSLWLKSKIYQNFGFLKKSL